MRLKQTKVKMMGYTSICTRMFVLYCQPPGCNRSAWSHGHPGIVIAYDKRGMHELCIVTSFFMFYMIIDGESHPSTRSQNTPPPGDSDSDAYTTAEDEAEASSHERPANLSRERLAPDGQEDEPVTMEEETDVKTPVPSASTDDCDLFSGTDSLSFIGHTSRSRVVEPLTGADASPHAGARPKTGLSTLPRVGDIHALSLESEKDGRDDGDYQHGNSDDKTKLHEFLAGGQRHPGGDIPCEDIQKDSKSGIVDYHKKQQMRLSLETATNSSTRTIDPVITSYCSSPITSVSTATCGHCGSSKTSPAQHATPAAPPQQAMPAAPPHQHAMPAARPQHATSAAPHQHATSADQEGSMFKLSLDETKGKPPPLVRQLSDCMMGTLEACLGADKYPIAKNWKDIADLRQVEVYRRDHLDSVCPKTKVKEMFNLSEFSKYTVKQLKEDLVNISREDVWDILHNEYPDIFE